MAVEDRLIAAAPQLREPEVVEQKPVIALVKAAKPRKGKHAANEKKLRDLSQILYGDGSRGKQQQEAEWDEECDYFMATNNARAERSETFS